MLLVATLLIAAILAAGCTGTSGPVTPATSAAGTSYIPPATITTIPELVRFVADAAAYARENGREQAIAAFNDPNGTFAVGNLHIFAVGYDGIVVADAGKPEIRGTNLSNMTDSFGIPIIEVLGETARFGRGYVSYTYPNPAKNNTFEPQLAVVENVDGTYYVGAGFFASEGEIYPSVQLNTSGGQPDVDDLVAYVKSAVAYAKTNGRESALAAFNDPKGQFVQGELVMMAFDCNGTNLASPPYSPELPKYRINLINYYDPDGVATIRGMRDLAREGGGFLYTVAKVMVNGTEVYVPKIDYAEPVDGDWWVFSGIIVPEYVGDGNMTGIQVRNHTREELYRAREQGSRLCTGEREEYDARRDQQSGRAVRERGPFRLGVVVRWNAPCRPVLEVRDRAESYELHRPVRHGGHEGRDRGDGERHRIFTCAVSRHRGERHRGCAQV